MLRAEDWLSVFDLEDARRFTPEGDGRETLPVPTMTLRQLVRRTRPLHVDALTRRAFISCMRLGHPGAAAYGVRMHLKHERMPIDISGVEDECVMCGEYVMDGVDYCDDCNAVVGSISVG